MTEVGLREEEEEKGGIIVLGEWSVLVIQDKLREPFNMISPG